MPAQLPGSWPEALPPMSGGTAAAERSLVDAARRGNVAAFEQLYRATVGRVFALCVRMTGDRHLAEELTQDAYLLAWQRLPGFRGDSAFATWLHRVAVNLVLSHRRGPGRRDRHYLDVAAELGPAPASAGHAGAAIDLERAIAGLPAGARTVFVLHDVEGYRHEEIAELARIAVGTSKAQLSRARRLLREALLS